MGLEILSILTAKRQNWNREIPSGEQALCPSKTGRAAAPKRLGTHGDNVLAGEALDIWTDAGWGADARFEGRPGANRKSDFDSPWHRLARRVMLFVSKWAHHFVDFDIGAS